MLLPAMKKSSVLPNHVPLVHPVAQVWRQVNAKVVPILQVQLHVVQVPMKKPRATYLSTPLPKFGGRSMQMLSLFSRFSAMLYMFLVDEKPMCYLLVHPVSKVWRQVDAKVVPILQAQRHVEHIS